MPGSDLFKTLAHKTLKLRYGWDSRWFYRLRIPPTLSTSAWSRGFCCSHWDLLPSEQPELLTRAAGAIRLCKQSANGEEAMTCQKKKSTHFSARSAHIAPASPGNSVQTLKNMILHSCSCTSAWGPYCSELSSSSRRQRHCVKSCLNPNCSVSSFSLSSNILFSLAQIFLRTDKAIQRVPALMYGKTF